MKRLILLAMIFITILACQSIKYVRVPMSAPPAKYYIPAITNKRDLIKAYQESVIKISEWQLWYNIQSQTNYFNYKENK